MIEPVSLFPFSAAILSAVLAVISAARPLRRTLTARWFLLLNVCSFLWTAAYFIQLNWGTFADPALAPIGSWQHGVAWMIGIGLGGTATYLFLFAAVAAGRTYWSTSDGILLAHVPFAYTLLVGVTNPLHGLFLVQTAGGAPTGGPLAWPHYISVFALNVSAAWLLISSAVQTHTAAGRRQAITIALAFAVTTVAALVFVFGPMAGVMPQINPVPVVFPVLSVVLGYQVLYHGLGDVVPLPTLAAIMDNAEIPLAYMDHGFRLISVNSAFQQHSKHTEWELVGRQYFELFPDGERRTAFAQAARTGKPVEVRADTGLFPRKPEDAAAYWDWTLSPVGSEGGEPQGFVLSLSDVTNAVYERALSDRLSELDDRIHSSLSASSTLIAAVGEAAEAIGAESGALVVVRDERPVWVACCGVEPGEWEPFVDEDHPPLAYAYHRRQMLNTTDPDLQQRVDPYVAEILGMRSVLALPLVHGGRRLGAVAFEARSAPATFGEVKVGFARRFAASLALALDNARRYESERTIAQTLQESMLRLPSELPAVEYANAYHSATEASRVGGDFYDLFDLEDGSVAMLVGDVSGHGLEAAVLTSLIKNTVRAHAYENQSPSQVMAKTNEIFRRQTAQEIFATAFFAVLRPDTGVLTYCSAGHPLSMIVRTDCRVEPLAEGSPIIGMLSDLEFTEAQQLLLPGDLLVMYTDGVTEARRDSELFGEERLTAVLAGLGRRPPESIVSAIFDSVVEYTHGQLRDDIALLAVRLSPLAALRHDEPVLASVAGAEGSDLRPEQ